MANKPSRRFLSASLFFTLVAACGVEFTSEPCPPGHWPDNSVGVCRLCDPGKVPDFVNGGCKACGEGQAPDENWECKAPGGAGSSGAGGGGAGSGQPNPVCDPNATKCGGDAQQTCDAAGQWGAPKACDISCDAAGSKCIVPVQVVVTSGTACALLSDKTVRCWGGNSHGQLGNGTETGSLKPTPVAGISNAEKLVAGASVACVVNYDKSAACWGWNNYSQIVESLDGANEVIRAPLVLGLADVREVAVGLQNICALTGSPQASSVQCRGKNDRGQLGNGTTMPSSKFETVKGLPAAIRTIGVGSNHACAVSEQGAAFCWGTGAQVGTPDDTPIMEAAPVGGNASSGIIQLSLNNSGSFAVRGDGALMIWGGFIGDDDPPFVEAHEARLVKIDVKVSRISSELTHACVSGQDGSVWCWGYNGANQSGQVGGYCPGIEQCDGFYVRSPFKTSVKNAVTSAVGSSASCALTSDGEIYCWGSNTSGQIGTGRVTESELPLKVVWK